MLAFGSTRHCATPWTSSTEAQPGASPRLEPARDVVQIELGSSIVEGQMIEHRLKAEGFKVSLLRHEDPHTGEFVALGRCDLLVASEEEGPCVVSWTRPAIRRCYALSRDGLGKHQTRAAIAALHNRCDACRGHRLGPDRGVARRAAARLNQVLRHHQ
jgi:hypothetical protein